MFFKALMLVAALECGWISGGMFNYTSKRNELYDIGVLYTSVDTEIRWRGLYVGGGMDCYVTPLSLTNYSPFQMTYNIGAGVRTENVTAGWEHSCFHPMQPYATIIGNEIKPKYEGAYDRFFVRIETR